MNTSNWESKFEVKTTKVKVAGNENVRTFSAMIFVNKKAVLPQGNRAMPQVFFSVEVRQQHFLQV